MQVVGAIIRNQKGEYLLQLRDDKAPRFKNSWTLFGGQVEPGETPRIALIRELNEELLLNERDIKSIRRVQVNQGDVEQIIYEVFIRLGIDELTLGEGAAMEYVLEADLLSRTFAFNIEAVLRDYLASYQIRSNLSNPAVP